MANLKQVNEQIANTLKSRFNEVDDAFIKIIQKKITNTKYGIVFFAGIFGDSYFDNTIFERHLQAFSSLDAFKKSI